MSDLDLDALRGRWIEQGRAIDAGLRLDAAALRAALDRRIRTARGKQMRASVRQVCGDGALLAALAAYATMRSDQPTLVALAVGVAAAVMAHCVAGVRQMRLLRALDPTAPVPQALATMAAIRELRLRMARMIALLSLLLWWPMLIVAIDAAFGVNPLPWLHPSVIWVNVVLGVLWVPLGGALFRWMGRRYGHRPGMRAFLDTAAGRAWLRMRDALLAGERLDTAIADGDLRAHAPLPAPARAALRRLDRRLLFGIAAAAAALLAVGVFNALHGGQARFLVPGVVLNVFAAAQLAFCAHNRVALRRAAGMHADALRAVLASIARHRRRLAATTLALAPVWGAALAQVLGEALAGTDLLATLPPMATVAVVAGIALAAGLGAAVATVRARVFHVLALGVPAAAERVRQALDSPGDGHSG